MKLINKNKIQLAKKDNNKFDISKLISTYADKNADVNQWHEVLCEAFSLYETYDYIKNDRLLLPEAKEIHKKLVDFLLSYEVIESGFIDDLDIDYYM